jgi:hypothetical protein
MAYESLGNTGLVRALSDVLGDLSELVQKEIRLAKAEVTENISFKLKASVWMVAAGSSPLRLGRDADGEVARRPDDIQGEDGRQCRGTRYR